MKKIVFYLVIALIAGLLSIVLMFPDWDLWARLAVGSLFFQTGGVLKQDIFSYAPTRDLWIDHEWGSGVIFFFLTDHFGDLGLFALKFIILFLILFLIASIIKLHIGKDHNIALFYPIFIGFSILPGVQNVIRSQMFTFLFFVLWLYILERVRKGENRLLWILPVTMIIWANMHGGFVAGLGLLFIYTLGEFLNRKNPLKYLGTLILSIAATLINPYGAKYWPYIYEATTMTRPLIPEWQPITLTGPVNMFMGIPIHAYLGFMIFALLVIIIGIRLFYKKANADWISILTVLFTLYMGLKHQRHAFFFIIAASSLFYPHYAALFEYLKELFSNKFNKNIDIWFKAAKNTLSIFLIVITVILLKNILSISPVRFVVQPNIYPVGSFEFIKQNNLSGNLATTYNWGSYALWKLYPQCKVLIDGRSEEVYPQNIIDITAVFSEKLNHNWVDVINKLHADIIVLPKRAYYPMDFLALPDWQIVYEDAISVLLLPKSKSKDLYVKPNFNNPVYWKEDLSKHVNLN
ncbi:MAG: hypothetical protein ACD_20C00328G0016 [uncultured bacterium]|nr:MAG: hypothetical protein ACD_20C00328G0016 [uncultured bacterium]HBH18028.1 hypothetical protein [Cyanobacteria bacterium UBA9579]